MLAKLYTIGVVFLDVLLLFWRIFVTILEALYNFFVPVQEKSVVGEIVLITGTGHGIGRELALQYGELGATVICVDIDETGNSETAKLMNEIGIKKVHHYTCDVTKREDVNSLVKRVAKEVGPITVLVNNAGIMPCHRFLDHKPEEIMKVFEVNVFAHFWLLQAVLPNMIAKNHGHVVALSSMAGIIGLRNLVPYCASKFAVRGMIESLIEEFREEGKAPDVKFTCIFPYMVNTGLCKKPKIRFENALGLVSPKLAAASIIKAMRTNKFAITIPPVFMALNDTIRLFPHKVGQHVKDFFDSGVEACE